MSVIGHCSQHPELCSCPSSGSPSAGQAGKLVVSQEVPKHLLVFPLTLLPHKPAASAKVKA